MTTRPHHHAIPDDILALSHERDQLRRRGQYDRADALKRQIEEAGFAIKDNPRGAHLIILPSIEVDGQLYHTARYMPSLLDQADRCLFSVHVLARHNLVEVRRCVESVLQHVGNHAIEVLLVDNAAGDELRAWTSTQRFEQPSLRVLHISRAMGAAEARNLGLKQSLGQYILLLDASIEVTGDIFTPLAEMLARSDVGITGLQGLHTEDLRHFEASSETGEVEVEAVNGMCMAFKRYLLKEVGLLDEKYRFPAYMDIDFNFTVRARGARAVLTPDLPVVIHPLQQDENLSAAEQARLTKRNFYHFLEKWGDRDNLLLL